MPPKSKTTQARPAASTARKGKVTPAAARPKSAKATYAEPESTRRTSVRIPELDLTYSEPTPSAAVAKQLKKIPDLVFQPRRGWKGAPLPFDTEASALAWGLKDMKIKDLRGSLASKSEKYTKSRRKVRDLQNDVTAAANRHGKHVDFVGKQLAEWRRIRVPRPSGPGSGKGSAWPNVDLSFDQLSDSTDVEGGAIRAYPAGARRASTIPRAGTR